jgi:hypothetical protein
MFRAHATASHPQGLPHFEPQHSALAEAALDAAWAAAWLLLWLAFLVSVAQPVAAPGPALEAGRPAAEVTRGAPAQPDPGPSSRGVAPAAPAGAG